MTEDLRANVMERFLLLDPPAVYLKDFEKIKSSLPVTYKPVADAFENNFTAVLATTGIPMTLANAAITQMHWQRIFTAERIRHMRPPQESNKTEEDMENRCDHQAATSAKRKMNEFMDSKDGQMVVAKEVCRFLLDSLRYAEMDSAASELLRQGTVLAWTSLEILCRDFIETVLNERPSKAVDLYRDRTASHRIQLKFTLEDLSEYDFDVSKSIGSVICSQQDFSDIKTIKALLFPILDNDPKVITALNDPTLWRLCQQRHLIVHRRGVIDSRYLVATGDSYPRGSQISIRPAQISRHLTAVAAATTAILLAAVQQAS